MRHKNLTSKAPADQVISEKLAGLKAFPGPGRFDSGVAWEKLDLPRPSPTGRIRWLVAAAGFCVLAGGSFWFYAFHPASSVPAAPDKPSLSVHSAPKHPPQRSERPVAKKTGLRLASAKSPKQKARKTGTQSGLPETHPSPQTTPAPKKEEESPFLPPSSSVAADGLAGQPVAAVRSPDEKPDSVAAAPVVYYQEIAADRRQPARGQKKHAPLVITLRPEIPATPVAVRRAEGAEQIKISLVR